MKIRKKTKKKIFKILVISLIGLVLLVFLFFKIGTDKINLSYNEKAEIELEDANYNNAKRLYTLSLTKNKNDVQAILGINSIYMKYHDYQSSVSFLEPYLYLNRDILYSLTNSLYKLKSYDKAYSTILTSINLNTDNTLSENDNELIEIALKILNITSNKEKFNEFKGILANYTLNDNVLSNMKVTEYNINITDTLDLRNLNLTPIASIYKKHVIVSDDVALNIQYKAQIIHELIEMGEYEYAYPLIIRIQDANRFYENNVIYYSIVNLELSNFEEVNNFLVENDEIIKNKETYNFLLLYSYLGLGNNEEEIIDCLNKLAFHEETYKLLYKFHEYNQLLDLYSKTDTHTLNMEYLVMKASIFSDDLEILKQTSDILLDNIPKLDNRERSTLFAIRAYLAYLDNNDESYKSLLASASELEKNNFIIFFVKNKVNYSNKTISRAFELDFNNELPR